MRAATSAQGPSTSMKSGRELVWYSRTAKHDFNNEQIKGKPRGVYGYTGHGVKLSLVGGARNPKKGGYDDRVELEHVRQGSRGSPRKRQHDQSISPKRSERKKRKVIKCGDTKSPLEESSSEDDTEKHAMKRIDYQSLLAKYNAPASPKVESM